MTSTSLAYRASRVVLLAALFISVVAGARTIASARLREEGWATFYATRRAGRHTASGKRYDPAALVAAHPRLPFGTRVRVTRLETGTAVVVEIIDRGPGERARRRGYVIDLSRAAAESLGFVHKGRARVRLEVVSGTGSDSVGVRRR